MFPHDSREEGEADGEGEALHDVDADGRQEAHEPDALNISLSSSCQINFRHSPEQTEIGEILEHSFEGDEDYCRKDALQKSLKIEGKNHRQSLEEATEVEDDDTEDEVREDGRQLCLRARIHVHHGPSQGAADWVDGEEAAANGRQSHSVEFLQKFAF